MTVDFAAQPANEIDKKSTSRGAIQKAESIEVKPTGKSKVGEKAPTELTETEQQKKVQELQSSLASHGIDLKFTRDEETKVMVVEMIDQKTGEALRQMPSKVSLKLQAELGKLQGLIYNRKV